MGGRIDEELDGCWERGHVRDAGQALTVGSASLVSDLSRLLEGGLYVAGGSAG